MKVTILVVDDEKNILMLFKKLLKPESVRLESSEHDENFAQGVVVKTASDGQEAFDVIANQPVDLIVSDLAMANMDGMALLKKAKEHKPNVPFIMITGVGSIEDAVRAMKLGAFDYITKPFQRDEMLLTIKKALQFRMLHVEIEQLRHQLNEKSDDAFSRIIGKSKPIEKVLEMVRIVSQSDATVLIEGESGTGKELVAKSIHMLSQRKDNPFVAINCGAIPETLLESELFGHAKGSFTGAFSDKKGIFESAHRGTLFLDEIADVSPAMQAKLLRAIQEREIRPVGGNAGTKFDVRIITATNKPLSRLVGEKKFREDLYYRLAVIIIAIPALRERKDDIPILVSFFIDKYCKANGKKFLSVSQEVLEAFTKHQWPGNIRELENLVERAVVIATPQDVIGIKHLPPGFSRSGSRKSIPIRALNPKVGNNHHDSLASESEVESLLEQDYSIKDIVEYVVHKVEKIVIDRALRSEAGNKASTARKLGISRPSLYSKLDQYGLNE